MQYICCLYKHIQYDYSNHSTESGGGAYLSAFSPNTPPLQNLCEIPQVTHPHPGFTPLVYLHPHGLASNATTAPQRWRRDTSTSPALGSASSTTSGRVV